MMEVVGDASRVVVCKNSKKSLIDVTNLYEKNLNNERKIRQREEFFVTLHDSLNDPLKIAVDTTRGQHLAVIIRYKILNFITSLILCPIF